MTTFQLVQLIIKAKNKKEIIRLLNLNRVPVEKSKYC